ncbi:MAG: bifunctional diaminohydroxyphosphoribosylaminopyrimidine deaminase/5-amino-6-(5-phosphoribosylamino)uracil reductase RibD [Rhizobiaceae bacterium]
MTATAKAAKLLGMGKLTEIDRKMLNTCLRYARRHRGLTASNPSVGTLLVQFCDGQPVVVGRGITAIGGRPHAERVAVDQVGTRAKGSTAYVTLEPCAHHGATPPCARALIDAGVARVVTALSDPDARVDGRGHAMLRHAGIEVVEADEANSAAADLAGYLTRKEKNSPQVILKLAVSLDGKLGLPGQEVPITGEIARSYVHRMRAEYDAILVGRGTVDADDPELTCRLPGLEHRSPKRFVLDSKATLSVMSKLASTANTVPISVITSHADIPDGLKAKGVTRFAAEEYNGQLALPEILEDMAADGISTLLVEGGAKVAKSFLEQQLVNNIVLFTAAKAVGADGIASPVSGKTLPKNFSLERTLRLGDDRLDLLYRT